MNAVAPGIAGKPVGFSGMMKAVFWLTATSNAGKPAALADMVQLTERKGTPTARPEAPAMIETESGEDAERAPRMEDAAPIDASTATIGMEPVIFGRTEDAPAITAEIGADPICDERAVAPDAMRAATDAAVWTAGKHHPPPCTEQATEVEADGVPRREAAAAIRAANRAS